MVKEQFKHEHKVDEDETRFRFNTSGRRETSISIDFERFPQGKWALSKETAHHKVHDTLVKSSLLQLLS